VRKLPLAIALATITTWSLSASARVGDDLATARKHAKAVNARVPTFVLKNRKVIREHWEAPPEMWTEAQADRLRSLIVGNARFVKRWMDGSRPTFDYTGGISVQYLPAIGTNRVVNLTAKSGEYKMMDDINGKYQNVDGY
jgi:hypothetical protein